MKISSSPPRLMLRFFRWFCHPKLLKYIEGDLIELYNERFRMFGKRKADRRYIIDVLLLFRPGIVRPLPVFNDLSNLAMYWSNFKIGWRNISRQKVYTAINVFGLALGICTSIVIYCISNFEFSFDSFHPNKGQLYRVLGEVTESTGDKLTFARLPIPLLQDMKSHLSGVDAIGGIIPFNVTIAVDGTADPSRTFNSTIPGTHYITTVIADPQYFDIFRYEWLAGDEATALISPNSVVLTEARARQYFGVESLDKIIGRQVVYEDSLRANVAGIVKEWSGNSDLCFTDFISSNTLSTNYLRRRIDVKSWSQGSMVAWIFIKVTRGTVPKIVDDQLEKLAQTHAEEIKLSPRSEPLSEMHFNADIIENPIRTAHQPTLYSLIGIAAFILLLAIVNFVNLSTAQSIRRTREVGVRKVLGSSRGGLVLQFLTETFLITLLATSLALCFAPLALSAFELFIPSGVSFDILSTSTLLFLVLLIVGTTLFAGLYPSAVLSYNDPIMSLRGSGTQSSGGGWLLRKGLIVFQFSVSAVFLVGSLVIANQLQYTREKDLGFKSDAILTLETPGGTGYDKAAAFSQKVRQLKHVDLVAMQWLPPMAENARGMKLKFKSTDEQDFWVTQVAGDEEFIPLYQIKVLAGRNLVRSDTVNEFVVNESLCRLMGCSTPEEALGKVLYWDDKPYPVVGVVSDFHTSSLRDPITPLCIINRQNRESSLAIKLATAGYQSELIKESLSSIEQVWKEIYPDATFNYRFYDDSLALLYQRDQQTATLVSTSMSMAILISCIGLFGLTLFAAENRAKEMSIRKILGASVSSITAMFCQETVALVMTSLVIAFPLAWYSTSVWLQGFAYHITVGWWVFVTAGVSVLTIALATVSFQALKVAHGNPVDALRLE